MKKKIEKQRKNRISAKKVDKKIKSENDEQSCPDITKSHKTPKQTSKILDVNLSTLWRWKKKKYLMPIEIGGKRRYRLSDIERLLNGGKAVQ